MEQSVTGLGSRFKNVYVVLFIFGKRLVCFFQRVFVLIPVVCIDNLFKHCELVYTK